VIGDFLHLPATATTIVGATLCFGLRLMAIHRAAGICPLPVPIGNPVTKHIAIPREKASQAL
jgi:hypothetical protein